MAHLLPIAQIGAIRSAAPSPRALLIGALLIGAPVFGTSVFGTLALTAVSAPAEASVTRAQCEANRTLQLQDIEANREGTLAKIRRQIALAETADQREGLEALMEGIWDEEEQLRGQAEFAYRDCLRHATG